MSHLLTNSRLRAERDCPRLGQFLFDERYRPVHEDAPALRFGSAFHTLMEEYWKGSEPVMLRQFMANLALEGMDEYERARLEAVVLRYTEHYERPWLEWDVVSVEQEFKIPLLNPATMAPSRTFELAGKIDDIVKTREGVESEYWVVEHKTTSEPIEAGSKYWQKLHIDHQVSAYFLAAEAAGLRPKGVIYDVVKVPRIAPLEATPEEKRKYTKKTGALYAGQRDRDETPHEYFDRVYKAVTPDHFARAQVTRSQEQILEFMHDAWAQGKAIIERRKWEMAPRNPENCFRFRTCPFFECCSTSSHPKDHPSLYQKVEKAHPELNTVE